MPTKRNIILAFLSIYREDSRIYYYKHSRQNGEIIEGVQSNEAAVKYILQNIAEREGNIDRIFLLVSKKVKRDIFAINNENLPNNDILKRMGGRMDTLTFFKQRIMTDFSYISEEKFATIDYDEDKEGIDAVLTMAQQVREYAEKEKIEPESITMHADMTGGMRNATMLMLAIMRLLKYKGFQAGKVLYANFDKNKDRNNPNIIDDITDIYNIFDLIAGAEEFVRFGSVKAIQGYFNSQPNMDLSRECKHLVVAMDKFSEQIKLCRADTFNNALGILGRAIAAFKQNERMTATPQEKFFHEIAETIESKYAPVLRKNDDVIATIKWCAENGYLQQALTIYTEQIPGYLKNRGFFSMDKDIIERAKKEQGHQTIEYALFCRCQSNHFDKKVRNIDKYSDYRCILQNGSNKNIEPWRLDFSQLGECSSEIELVVNQLKKVNDGNVKHMSEENIKKEYPFLYHMLCKGKKGHKDMDFSTYLRERFNIKQMYTAMVGISRDYMEEWLHIELPSPTRIEHMKVILEEKEINIFIKQEDFISILEDYYYIQSERNNTNHAGNNVKTPAEDLKNTILKAIKTIENSQPTKTLKR